MMQPGDDENEDQGQVQDEPQQESLNVPDFTQDLAMNEAVAIPDPKKRTT
jgi:hypothetical protein